MNARASTTGTFLVITLCTLYASACGGGSSEAPPAAAPGNVEPPTNASATEASAPQAASAPSSADPPPAPSGAEPPDPPSDLGAGDSRTTDSIATLVKAHRKEARDCYEKALKQIPGLKGDVVIHFTLKPSGEVKQAELNEERSTIREASVSTCVIGVIRAIPFPKSSKGLETTVNYPFNFNP